MDKIITGSSFLTIDVTSVLVTGGLGIVCYILYVFLYPKDVWSQYGVFQPKLSSSIPFLDFRKGFKKLMDEYGDTVGLKRAGLQLVTRDLDLVKEVLVKDFNNFTDRGNNFVSNSPLMKSVLLEKGNNWRRLRRLTSPSFSTASKMKVIGQTVNETAESLANFLVQCSVKEQLIPLKYTTAQYTSSIIAKSAFGLQIDCIGKDDDEFTSFSKNMFKQRKILTRYLMLLFFRFPAILKFLITKLKLEFFEPVSQDSDVYFKTVLNTSVQHRQQLEKEGKRKPDDFFQQLMDTKADTDASEKPLTEEEIVGQSMIIIFAGFETTASTLQFLLYIMAKYPDIQEKMFAEIEKEVTSPKPTQEELGQLTYVEQVINETLRMYSPASLISRRALETKTYGSITIPKGADVVIPIYSILRDERHYPDPDKFDPERFSAENKSQRHPMAFMAFGQGPRICLGMKLAYLELKVALVHVLRKVKVELNDQTQPKKGEDVVISNQNLIKVETPITLSCRLR